MRGILKILLPLGLLLIVGAATPVLAADSWTIGAPAPTFPTALVWEKGPSTNPSVVANNTGDSWDTTCGLSEVGTLIDALKRWTLAGKVNVTGTVANGGSFTFALPIVAPPLTTLKYNLPIGPTDVAVAGTLPCNWNMVRGSAFMSGSAEVPTPIAVNRFSDIQGTTYSSYIEELAGAVPTIVQGYTDGTYKPMVTVTRDQMAVYLQRALQLPTAPATGMFSDVPSSYWAAVQIEAVARAGIALGYTGGVLPYYAPTAVVSRDQMAVFVARGMVGGDSKVPAGPATASFSDVPTSYWAFKYIEYCKAQGVVQGIPPTYSSYNPADSVTRDQMAKFVYNAFVVLTAPAVLGGPAITQVNLSGTPTYFGWPSSAAARGSNTGYAYCVFDALRLQPSLLTKGAGGKWNISFALWSTPQPASLLNPPVLISTTTVQVSSATITSAYNSAKGSGVPYYVVAAQLPVLATTNPAGWYQLQVTVGDATGTGQLLARQPTYNIP